MKVLSKDEQKEVTGGGWITVLKVAWKNGKKIVKKARKWVNKNPKKAATGAGASLGATHEATRMTGSQP